MELLCKFRLNLLGATGIFASLELTDGLFDKEKPAVTAGVKVSKPDQFLRVVAILGVKVDSGVHFP